MPNNHSSGREASGRKSARAPNKQSSNYRRMSKAELRKIGFSEKSERYVLHSARRITSRTATLSKRQFSQKKLSEESGRRVTLEQRAHEYLTGQRQALTAKHAEMREKSLQLWRLKKQYPGENIRRIREHQRNMLLKASGEHLEYDIYLREKAFSEAHLTVSEERGYYQQWFNYGHIKRATQPAGRNSR